MINKNSRLLPIAVSLEKLVSLPLILAASLATAQAPELSADQPLPAETATQLSVLYDAIGSRRDQIEALEAVQTITPDSIQMIYSARLDRAWISLLDGGVAFIDAVVSAQDAGYELEKFKAFAIEVQATQASIGKTAWDRMRAAAVLPDSGASAAEQAAGYARLFDLQFRTDRIFDSFMTGLMLIEQLGIDTTEDRRALREVVAERASMVSVFLELSHEKVRDLQAGNAALPDDVELLAKLRVAENRVEQSAAALERVIAQMDQVELDTEAYRTQVLSATGAITTDVLDVGVVRNILSRWGNSLANSVADHGPQFLFRCLIFLLIIFIFRKMARVIERLVARGLQSSQLELSLLFKRMITSIVGNIVVLLGFLVALSQLGISLGPLLAGLGIAGFVIGFALQDSLANFASGMLILLYRPFDEGDIVEVGGVFGKVSDMSLVNTTVLTLDNQTIVLPNNMIWGGVIKNLTDQRHRRVDLTFSVSYSEDIPRVEQILSEIVAAHDMVLDDPKPTIRLHELGESSVNFIVRPWVESDDYWDVYWDLMREVKMRFDAEGISIPFPQRDVHMMTSGDTPGPART